MQDSKGKRKVVRIDKTIRVCIQMITDAGSIKELIMTLFLLISGGVFSILAIFEKNFYNEAAKLMRDSSNEAFQSTFKWLSIWAVAVIIITLLSFISSNAKNKLWSRMNYYIQEKLMDKVSRIRVDYFDSVDAHTKFNWVKNELSAKVPLIIDSAFGMISSITQLTTAALIVITDNWIIALIVLAGSIPAVILNQMQTEANYHNDQKNSQELRFQTYISWVMFKQSFMKEMRFGNLYDYINKKFENSVLDLHIKRQKIIKKYTLANGGARLISHITIAIALIIVSYDIYMGKSEIGSFMLIYSSAKRMQSAFQTMFVNFVIINSEGRFVADYVDILNYEEESLDKSIHEHPSNADIKFNNVTFRYPETEKNILNNISVEINRGERIAIVGENGSGKSTFIALLCGLYKPDSGNINFGGKDIKEDISNLRKAVSCTFQNFGHYDMSIADNIRIGDPDREYSDEDIIEVVKISGAYEFIKDLKNGINSHLGSLKKDGTRLSGGQWQKIAMARTLFKKDAEILVLDEPTAALDPISEAKLYEDFDKMAGDRTVILISHRLGATRLADRILVFDNGNIIEAGSHEQLMKLKGMYAKMYQAQAQWYIT